MILLLSNIYSFHCDLKTVTMPGPVFYPMSVNKTAEKVEKTRIYVHCSIVISRVTCTRVKGTYWENTITSMLAKQRFVVIVDNACIRTLAGHGPE